MNKKILTLVGILSALLLLVGSFSAGIIVGNFFVPEEVIPDTMLEEVSPVPGNGSEKQATTTTEDQISREELFEPFWEAWDILHEQYVDQPLDDTSLMRGAISGMLDSLGDPHTSYMDPFQFEQANIPMSGEYEGIGAWVDPTGKYLEIISPMPNSPAEKAGLKPGDKVIAIDGEDMTGIDGNLVIKEILGPAGTDVVLTIEREGEPEPFDVTVTRQKITIPSVEYRMIEGENIAHLQLITFGQDTRSELRDAIKDLLANDPDGLILDLRNNGGGYLQTAVTVASEFIEEGVILYEDYGDDQEMKSYQAQKGGLATDIPLVVLVNEGSASASEIVAGAIQDYERGPLVGATTFGKGSVQNWIELSNDEGAIRVTIARWLTPDKRQIHEQGLTPNYEVELTEEDVQNEEDPQLDKAIELMIDLIEK
ncbi:MAG: S41 family peptidase [Anaerolineales bacterium]